MVSQESKEPVMPKRSSLSRRGSRGTESKAFLKSRNITSVERHLSSALAHSWKKLSTERYRSSQDESHTDDY